MKQLKKTLCFLLCCALCLGCFPLTAFAAEGESAEETAEFAVEEAAIEAEMTEEVPAEEPVEAETEEAPAEEPAEVEPEEAPTEEPAEVEPEEAPAEEPSEAEEAEEAPAETEKIEVTFVCEGADLALLEIFAKGDREHPMEAKEPGVYELLPGEYIYIYPGMDETGFTVGAEAMTVTFALPVTEEAPAEEPAEVEVTEEAPAEEPVEVVEAEEAPAKESVEAEVTEEAPAEEPAEVEEIEEAPAEEPAEVEETEEAPAEEPAEVEEIEEAPAEEPAEVEETEEAPAEEPAEVEETEEEPADKPAKAALKAPTPAGSPLPTIVESGEYGEVAYDLYSDGVLYVYGLGSAEDDGEYSPFDSNEAITSVFFDEGVTCIGESMFSGCTGIKDVTIADSVSRIGWDAFWGCTGLEEIYIPSSVKTVEAWAFGGCTSLETVELCEGVEAINAGAFLNCTALKQITIPSSVLEIGTGVFKGCTALETVKLYSAGPEIYYDTFRNCTSLTTISIPYGVYVIDEEAFYGCTNLKTVFIPSSMYTIGFHAFEYLNDVYYDGTKAEWDNIEIVTNSYEYVWYEDGYDGDEEEMEGTPVEFDPFRYATIHYNSEEIPLGAPKMNTPRNTSSGVKLSWNAVYGATGYRVGRKGPGETSYKLLDTTGATSFTDTTAVSGKTYSYFVRATKGPETSDHSPAVSILCVKSLGKPTVSSLTNSSSGVKLSWGKVANATGYRVGRKGPGQSSYELVGTPTGTSFTDTTAKAGTTYTYMVRATNGSVQSSYNTGKSIKCVKSLSKPTINTPKNSSSGVKLSWSAVTNATGYRVGRKGPGQSSYELVGTPTGTSFTDTTAKSGTTYTYMIRATNGSVQSGYNTVTFHCVKSLAKPKLNAPVNTAGGVKLSWSKVNNGKLYRVGRKGPGETTYKLLTATSGTSYTDSTAVAGKTYTYIVRAANDDLIGSYNTGKTILCVKSLSKPTLNTPVKSADGVKLTWSSVTNATGYRIGRKGPGESSYQLIGTPTGTTFVDADVQTGKTYTYIVRAANGEVQSGYNTGKSITVK